MGREPSDPQGLRPLVSRRPGVWRSRDGRFEFCRAEEDPHPRRWFTYVVADLERAGTGMVDPLALGGSLSLAGAVQDAREYVQSGEFADDYPEA